MTNYSLESFINFCDDMQIAEEKGLFGNSQISTYVNNTSLQNILVNQLNTQNIINQQQQMAVNGAMNASLNASAMSMGMPPGSFGMF